VDFVNKTINCEREKTRREQNRRERRREKKEKRTEKKSQEKKRSTRRWQIVKENVNLEDFAALSIQVVVETNLSEKCAIFIFQVEVGKLRI
jgi:hypothetical protein